jgi:hypothetical protein
VVASSNIHLLCFHLDDITYVDLTLPFGLKYSPFWFNLVQTSFTGASNRSACH